MRAVDSAAHDEERPPEARLPRRSEDAQLFRAKPIELGDPRRDLLERGDPVPEPRGVLEAQGPREPRQPRAQRRERSGEVVAVEVPERARRELRAALARKRPEARRLGHDDPALAAPPQVRLRAPARAFAGGRSSRMSRSSSSAASSSDPSSRHSTRASAPSAASTAGRWRSPAKYERSRARRSRALPT